MCPGLPDSQTALKKVTRDNWNVRTVLVRFSLELNYQTVFLIDKKVARICFITGLPDHVSVQGYQTRDFLYMVSDILLRRIGK